MESLFRCTNSVLIAKCTANFLAARTYEQHCPDVNNSAYTVAIVDIALNFAAEATAEFGHTEVIYASFTLGAVTHHA